MSDPYQQYPNPYGQQPGPYGSGPNPYGGGQPYGQPPYGGQPDPYGPYQGSYGQPSGWGAQGGGGGYPPVPPPKSKLPMVLLSVLAVLVIAGGVVTAVVLLGGDDPPPAAQTTSSQPTGAQPTTRENPTTTRSRSTTTTVPTPKDKTFVVGQCATLTPEPGNRATLNEIECGSTSSDVLVAKVQDADCVKDYITFNADVGKVYCLALDAQEGDCFKLEQLAKRAQSCTGGTYKVEKIFEDVTDHNKCNNVPNAGKRYAYPEPARTLCLVPASG